MRIGIIETGAPPGSLAEHFGTYDAMFRQLLGQDFAVESFKVAEGVLPPAPTACSAYLITGSPAGVYDELAWIARLKAFLQDAKGQAKLVGICFGHQIMAEAFGGKVEKSAKGWGLGLHRYEIKAQADWMDRVRAVAVPVSHQDQVVMPPSSARVIGGNSFTPYGILAYTDQPAISFQCHPEFDPVYARALIERMQRGSADPRPLDAAIDTFAEPNDRQHVGNWIRTFLRG